MNLHPDYLLNDVNEPSDIKKMSLDELKELATEMRQLVLERDAAIGGHVGPNLGVMELTLAYHYVFNSPHDKVIWDVSHQSYAHKMLTGRKIGFLDPDHYEDITGYTSPEESVHDFFEIGHTSTSISLAVGMAQARDLLRPEKHNNIVAVIGDGSLSGGLAFEGLNNAAKLHSNLIIVVYDNQMAIDKDQGGLYKGLKELRDSNGKSPNNIFKFMGLDYRYVADGNDLQTMIDAAHRSGKLFTVHQNRRWDVDFLAMKQLMKTGEIGELIRVESRIHGSRGIPSDWRGKKAYGGGMLYDWGVHLIDQLLQLTDAKIISVFAEFQYLSQNEVDDNIRLTLSIIPVATSR